ncbi:MAG TPA: serine hydrolase, partial [Bryobacteraceae bacterium]|nr:serine hydrolase [Bryobacteraceae bacterium]
RDMRTGQTFLDERFPNEVKYYDFPGAGLAHSVFPQRPGMVPDPYGGFYIEAMDSHGAWIASGADLVRFMLHVDGHLQPAPLKPVTVREMIASPGAPAQIEPNVWYGMGWQVRRVGNDANWWHTGSLPGTTTLMVRTSQGMHWAALFNTRPKGGNFASELDGEMWKAAGEVKEWPSREIGR